MRKYNTDLVKICTGAERQKGAEAVREEILTLSF